MERIKNTQMTCVFMDRRTIGEHIGDSLRSQLFRDSYGDSYQVNGYQTEDRDGNRKEIYLSVKYRGDARDGTRVLPSRIPLDEALTHRKYSPSESKPVSDLRLSVRARKAMSRLNVRDLGDLVDLTEADLSAIKGVGQVTLRQIKKMLNEQGLSLKP